MFFWLVFVVLLVGLSVLFGPPYVPTLKKDYDIIFELLDLQPNELFVDLGSGDGRLLREAAKRGYRAIGYEVNPLFWLTSMILTFPYRKQVSSKMQNFLTSELPPDMKGVYIFGAGEILDKVDNKIRQHNQAIKLVSHGFKITSKQPSKTRGAFILYTYP